MAEPNPSPRRGNREIWGDEPEEVDASAVVDQIETAFPDAERRWHDHPLIAPIKAVALFIKRSGKRIAVTIAGVAVILLGIVMLVLPGPGLLVIIAGLAFNTNGTLYGVTSDGQRFLVDTVPSIAPQSLELILKWPGSAK